MHNISGSIINKLKVDILYPRYSKVESQEHIIKYEYIRLLKEVFITYLKNKLKEVEKNSTNEDKIELIVNNIKVFLRNKNIHILHKMFITI